MQKVAPHVATRGRLLSQITASQRVDAARWPSDRHSDSDPKMVFFAAFPGLIKITSWARMTHLFWPSSLFIFISISYSCRCIFFHRSAAQSVWVSCLISGNLLLWRSPTLTGWHPQRCKQQQHPPAAEPRSYKRPFQSVPFSVLLNNYTCAAQNTRPSLCLLAYPHCRRRTRRRGRRRRCPFCYLWQRTWPFWRTGRVKDAFKWLERRGTRHSFEYTRNQRLAKRCSECK